MSQDGMPSESGDRRTCRAAFSPHDAFEGWIRAASDDASRESAHEALYEMAKARVRGYAGIDRLSIAGLVVEALSPTTTAALGRTANRDPSRPSAVPTDGSIRRAIDDALRRAVRSYLRPVNRRSFAVAIDVRTLLHPDPSAFAVESIRTSVREPEWVLVSTRNTERASPCPGLRSPAADRRWEGPFESFPGWSVAHARVLDCWASHLGARATSAVVGITRERVRFIRRRLKVLIDGADA